MPNFLSYIRDRDVLDHGCGMGTMVHHGARSAHGVDIIEPGLENGRRIAREHGLAERVTYSTDIPRRFEVCTSFSAFEHYADPVRTLAELIATVKPGGLVILSWAEPWYSPHGSHFSPFVVCVGSI